MIPIGRPNTGPIAGYMDAWRQGSALANGPVGVEAFGLPLRRPCKVCGWRRLLSLEGRVFCTRCSEQAEVEGGRVQT